MPPPDNETFSYPHKAAAYTYRVPTPPRIVVPPPGLNADALPDITLNALHSTDFRMAVNYEKLFSRNAVIDWTYECRRQAQMVLPYLYLGPMTAAKDLAFLTGESGHLPGHPGPITMLLCLRQKQDFKSKLMNGALHKARELGIDVHAMDLASNQELIRSFPQTTTLINEHLSRLYRVTGRLGKVLVFCESGNERAAAVVAAYLMETHVDVDYIKAMQLVQAQRFCANFEDGLKRLLQSYWDILCASRAVAVANEQAVGQSLSGPCPPTAKRALEREEDDDEAMGDDLERFGGRSFAPFVDIPL
ncbi:hypothetical protein M433DRAFT_156494 [Acidomyces richmondensis BFW]|nr:MAG: hypothetical protein FE78DRAFT_93299 [Acidomyces sp. 'richmondensis']KYG43629.1 hypothetical protein M433DRAFT_156494 [Acidomyces richmondensis BFW]